MFWVFICTVHLTVCSYRVTYTSQSEFIFYRCLNVKELLARIRSEIWSLSDCKWARMQSLTIQEHTVTGLQHLTICSCHVRYVLQSESMLYSCLNMKELLARSWRKIWSLSDCNWTRTQNHLFLKINGWEFVYKLSGSGFNSSCSHLNFRFRTWFEQGVPWYSANHRVWIHSETLTWHGKNIQLNVYW